MMKILNIFIVAGVLCGCSAPESYENLIRTDHSNEAYIVGKSNVIKFKNSEVEVLTSPSGSAIEQITEQRDNIVYKISKIDTKSHLIRQGVTDSVELEVATSDLQNEQLFYIEFRDNLKKDLLKQEFKDDYYSSAIEYLTDRLKSDFVMVFENDTIEPSFYSYERNFHVASFERILLGFSNVKTDGNMELIYQDRLFRKGTIKFKFPSNSYVNNNSEFVL